MSRLGKPIDDYPDGVKLVGRERQTQNKIHADVFPFLRRNVQRLQHSSRSHMIGLHPSTRVAFCNIASSVALHSSPPELCYQIVIHLCAAGVDGIFGSISFVEDLAQILVLWNHQTVLEPKSAFLIHTETVNLKITFGQPPLDMHDSFITALSCNDFPSQQRGEGHIILSHVWRHSNSRFFPSEADSRQVVAVSFVAQGIRNHIRLTGVIMNLKIIVLNQLQPPSLAHVQISLSENVLQALVVGEDMNHIPKKIVPPCPQSKNNNIQFKIMCGILLFKMAQLS
jgi:hypothetical protein